MPLEINLGGQIIPLNGRFLSKNVKNCQLSTVGLDNQPRYCISTKTHPANYHQIIIIDQIPENIAQP